MIVVFIVFSIIVILFSNNVFKAMITIIISTVYIIIFSINLLFISFFFWQEPSSPSRDSTTCNKIYFPCSRWKHGQEKGNDTLFIVDNAPCTNGYWVLLVIKNYVFSVSPLQKTSCLSVIIPTPSLIPQWTNSSLDMYIHFDSLSTLSLLASVRYMYHFELMVYTKYSHSLV